MLVSTVHAQEPRVQPMGNDARPGTGNRPAVVNGRVVNSNNINKNDSLKKRNKLEDSITISYRLLNNPQKYLLDSSVSDYTRFATQPHYITLGNNGAASKPILYTPTLTAGLSQGLLSYSAYKWYLHQVKCYTTTRPYTELGYVLGSKAEQNIHFTHTQNIKPNWNITGDLRIISAPGYFRSQRNNHSNAVLSSLYTSKKKRYNNLFVLLNNSLKANDYGGVANLSRIKDVNFADRSLIETKLNNNEFSARNPFNNVLESGHWNKERTYLLRQSYDFGKRDSIVINDSTTNYLFYSKLRIQHSITYTNEFYAYRGLGVDTALYQSVYGRDSLFKGTNFELKDEWQKVANELAIYQYPDTKNIQQYFKAAVQYEYWKGTFTKYANNPTSRSLTNIILLGEYRNKTKNKLWDINANGLIYMNGFNSGDYQANAYLARYINATLGQLKVEFVQVNRTPNFIFNRQSSFNVNYVPGLKKENSTQLIAKLYNAKKRQELTASLLVANNITTWQSPTTYRQEVAFNMLQVDFAKSIHLTKHLVLHTNVIAQKVLIGNPNINYPTLYTRNRIAYEGNLGKKNLKLATGLEFKYIAPYKLDAFSSLNGQFVYQDSVSSKNNLPDVTAYLHFSITSFNGFIRVENLNTATISTGNNGGLKFINNNFTAVNYPNASLVIRFGIYWRFIN